MFLKNSIFDERYYYWRISEWEREIRDNYPLLHSVREDVIQIMEALNDNEKMIMAKAFIKRGIDQKYLDKIGAILEVKGITADKVVKSGKPAEEIIHYAKTNAVDLIIMSTHGRSGVSRLMLGSVAERIIRQSDIPILLNHPSDIR